MIIVTHETLNCYHATSPTGWDFLRKKNKSAVVLECSHMCLYISFVGVSKVTCVNYAFARNSTSFFIELTKIKLKKVHIFCLISYDF